MWDSDEEENEELQAHTTADTKFVTFICVPSCLAHYFSSAQCGNWDHFQIFKHVLAKA